MRTWTLALDWGHLLTMALGLHLGLLSAAALLRQRLLLAREELSRRREEIASLEDRLSDSSEENDVLRGECRQLAEANASLRTALEKEQIHHGERMALLTSAEGRLENVFRSLAERLFDEKMRVFGRQSNAGLEQLLSPVRDQLGEFRRRVDEVHDLATRDRVALSGEINHLKALNLRIGEEAVNLARALKGSGKTRGAWGEMVLARLLEASGLRPGKEYLSQPSLHAEDGRLLRPDVVVRLPGGRDVVIDAKVSLNAYADYCASDDAAERATHLGRHLASVRAHVEGLSHKGYQRIDTLESLDFVLLFMPVEAGFITALEAEPELLAWAMERRVLLTSPSTLLIALRTVEHLWRRDEQHRNALIIAKQAGNLYDKFVGFIEALETVGTRLDQAGEAWRTARARLHEGPGNLVGRVEGLRSLGIHPSKILSPELTVRALADQEKKGLEDCMSQAD